MSPRPYRMAQRRAAIEQTRAGIVAAARTLLAAEGGVASFSMDAVAREAGVARMTIYYQFGTKRGLLEALFDDLAARAELASRLAAAMTEDDPRAALDGLLAAFAHFWSVDRLVMRRVRALALLDPEFGEAVWSRDGRRRQLLLAVLQRLGHGMNAGALADAAHTAHVLTSFETFDALAGPGRQPEEMLPVVRRLVLLSAGPAQG
jgi:AcrR family transcriptional regulator